LTKARFIPTVEIYLDFKVRGVCENHMKVDGNGNA